MKNLHLSGWVLLMVLFFGCNESKDEINEMSVEVEKIQLYSDFLSNDLGFNPDNFVYDPAMKAFVISGDGVFPLTSIDNWMEIFKEGKENTEGSRIDQQRASIVVSNFKVAKIEYFVESDILSTDWYTAIVDATTKWKNDVTSNVYFVRTTNSANADIVISDYTDNSTSTIAWAYLPSSTNKPGNTIKINRKYDYLSASKKLNAIAHEMGHTIGLTHTDESDYIHIPGTATPGNDNDSFMHSTVHDWLGFTTSDRLAIMAVYRRFIPSPARNASYSIVTGRALNITWYATPFPAGGTVNIYLYKNDVLYKTIATSYPQSNGSYAYTVPFDNSLVGQEMQVRIVKDGVMYGSGIFTYRPI